MNMRRPRHTRRLSRKPYVLIQSGSGYVGSIPRDGTWEPVAIERAYRFKDEADASDFVQRYGMSNVRLGWYEDR